MEIVHSEFLDGLARERLRARLSAYLAAEMTKRLGALLTAMEDPAPELRGIMFRLGEESGVMPAEPVPHELRPVLKKAGLDAGRFALYMPAVLKPGAAWLRALLWGVWHDRNPPELPAPGLVSAPMPGNWGADFALGMGWLPAGPVMVRLDVAERLVREMHYHGAQAPGAAAAQSRLAHGAEARPALAGAARAGLPRDPGGDAGRKIFRAAGAADARPAPHGAAARRSGPPGRRRAAAKPRHVRPNKPRRSRWKNRSRSPADSPFAALAALRRVVR